MASTEQKYFHDRIILLFLSINGFLTILSSLLILLRVDSGRNEGYIVQWRPNLGIGANIQGSVSELLAFVVFAIIVLILNTLLSYRIYRIHRHSSIIILVLGLVLLTVSTIVSNALLAPR